MEFTFLKQILFFALIVVGLPFLLSKVSKRKLSEVDGWKILKPPMEMLFLGIGSILMSGLVFFIDHDFSLVDIISILFVLFIFLSGASITIWYFRYFLYFNEIKIIFRPTVGQIVHMNWSDVKNVKYNKLMDRIILSDSNNKIYVDIQVSGYREFINFLKSKLPEELYSEALKIDKRLSKQRGLR